MSESEFDRQGKARALLNDPLYQEVMQGIVQRIHEAWASTPTHKKDELNELRLYLSVAKNFQKSFEAIAREGKSELHRLKQPTFLGNLLWKRNKAN